MIFWEYENKKSREVSGISKLGTNALQGFSTITDIINIMKLTHMMCFWGVFSAKWVEKNEIFCYLTVYILGLKVVAENLTQIHSENYL